MKPGKFLLSAFVISMASVLIFCNAASALNGLSEDSLTPSHTVVNNIIETKKQTPIKVEIIEENGSYQLLRGGKPYQVRGAGIGSTDLASLVKFGGNSMRNWAVDNHA